MFNTEGRTSPLHYHPIMKSINFHSFFFQWLIVAAVLLISCYLDGDAMTAGISLAATGMMAIGDMDDVSDRDTHGSNIAYQIYLISVDQVDNSKQFPAPNANREVGLIPMKNGEYMKYFACHTIPTYVGNGEKGDITTSGTNQFVAVMGGQRDKLLSFIEQYAGGKFIILFKEIEQTQWMILGSYDRPMILQTFENKNDADGRYVTFTFQRTSIDQYYKYTGAIVRAPAKENAKDATDLKISAGQDLYTIPEGTTAKAIATVSGLAANDKARFITLVGAGTEHASTIAENTVFILEDAKTWTARAGSRITFRVLDTNTLIEVSGSRIQTV